MAKQVEAYWLYETGRGPAIEEPIELSYARLTNIEDLRPWEFDGMSAWEYDKMVVALNAWSKARKTYPRVNLASAQQPQATGKGSSGGIVEVGGSGGPQYVDDVPEMG